jgi:hypothetical protein
VSTIGTVATESPLVNAEVPPEQGADGADHDRIVQLAYESNSVFVAERLGVTAETHWELYEAAAAAELDGSALAGLRRLTELYERATYAPDAVGPEASRWAFRVATRLEELAD